MRLESVDVESPTSTAIKTVFQTAKMFVPRIQPKPMMLDYVDANIPLKKKIRTVIKTVLWIVSIHVPTIHTWWYPIPFIDVPVHHRLVSHLRVYPVHLPPAYPAHPKHQHHPLRKQPIPLHRSHPNPVHRPLLWKHLLVPVELLHRKQAIQANLGHLFLVYREQPLQHLPPQRVYPAVRPVHVPTHQAGHPVLRRQEPDRTHPQEHVRIHQAANRLKVVVLQQSPVKVPAVLPV